MIYWARKLDTRFWAHAVFSIYVSSACVLWSYVLLFFFTLQSCPGTSNLVTSAILWIHRVQPSGLVLAQLWFYLKICEFCSSSIPPSFEKLVMQIVLSSKIIITRGVSKLLCLFSDHSTSLHTSTILNQDLTKTSSHLLKPSSYNNTLFILWKQFGFW